MDAQNSSIFRLKGSPQTYDWGKKGSASLVAQLGRGGISEDFEIKEETHYAEVSDVDVYPSPDID